MQAERLGAELLTPQEVRELSLSDDYKIVTLADGTKLTCRAIVLATGMKVRRLPATGCDELTGRGIYYGAALSEAAHYRHRPVIVVGGGNSAGQCAMFLSRYASEVTLLIRRGDLSTTMSRYLIDQIEATSKIKLATRREIVSVTGQESLESVTVKDLETGKLDELATAAVFIFIGSAPNASLIEGLVAQDEKGSC